MSDDILIPEDPHESKIDPDDPRLRLPKPRSRSLKKRPIIIISAVVSLLVMFGFTIALLSGGLKLGEKEKKDEPLVQNPSIPDIIKNAPDNTSPLQEAVAFKQPEPVEPEKEKPSELGKKLPADPGGTLNKNGQKQEDTNLKAALISKVFFNVDPVPQQKQSSHEVKNTGQKSSNTPEATGLFDAYKDTIDKLAGNKSEDPNQQLEKRSFLEDQKTDKQDYLSRPVSWPVSPYEVKAGSIIPASLITGLNSDLPGEVIGQVRENVYDTVTGNHLLIPQGSRLLATYDSVITYGQNRVLVCWTRLIRPDGSSVSLESMPGVELDGFSGFSGDVDNHYLRLVGGVLVSSILSVAATTSQGTDLYQDGIDYQKIFASNVGQDINQVGQQITKKNLQVQPSIKVPVGQSVNVLVNKDMIIPPYKAP
ncbi:Conjugation TrbI family protein [uncultured Desulfobacterium sp.]|uniref:Conjugation TrbI family protein n=1 Tax=uncultured Desulfobacterium sp. TaxID=201089 RepID=A0A445MSJ8_9BACT|nr:Conjugation TrbI family protein [uncultured Desulfobacterium sp.]